MRAALTLAVQTCRETDLVFSADESSLQNERRIAVVIAHEMAHLVRLQPQYWIIR